MTDKLYYKDGYLRSIEATVTAVRDCGIILDRTIFYPEGGGQPGDRGTFGRYQIADTVKDETGDPLHIINGERPAVGEKALLTLDWNRRYFYMMEHSAQHLVSAILFSKHGIGTVAVHQGENFFTIETDQENIGEDVLFAAEDEANKAVRENHSIMQREMSHIEAESLHMRRSIKVDGSVKVVFIDSVDAVACGGVHLKSTGEIGEIQYCGSERIRGHVRTAWKCGPLSVSYRQQNRSIVNASCALLSSEPDTLLSFIERLQMENSELKHSLKQLSEKLAHKELELYRDESIIIFRTDTSASSFENAFETDSPVTAFIVDSDGRFMFHGTKEGFDSLKAGLSAYSIRGGGRGYFFRGSVSGDIEAVLREARSLLNG